MKYSLNQLKRYVPALDTVEVKELIERIWQSVAEVESVEYLADKFNGIVVGKIVSIEKHAKSEKLVVVSVDIGKVEPVIVVTGAHNIAVGDFVPYIDVGAVVPALKDEQGNPIVISIRNMVGIPSVGMLASERELGFSDDHTGIMILHQDELRTQLVPGMSLASALEYDDVIIEIENKTLTHRGDCFSASGLARELSTLYSLEYVVPDWQKSDFSAANLFGDTFDQDMLCSLKVDVKAKDVVDRYSAIILDGIQVQKSPLWLRLFLAKHGINSVNNVVDITNYVMLDYGQPMHAFDAATVAHKKRDEKIEYQIVVRHAKAGEELVTLDDKKKVLPEIATVIADTNQPLGIAGIIGGKESGIKDSSTRIVLESAVFDKYAIRNTSMSLGVVTDASVVFSRKQDAEKTGRALLRAIHLLQEMAGAVIVSMVSDTRISEPEKKNIIISHERLEAFLGIAVNPVKVTTLLEGLGFEVVRKNAMYSVTVPSWRPDVGIDEDLYEEIARLIGYKEIAPELPTRGVFAVKLSRYEQVKQESLKRLTGLGFLQTMNFSFVSKSLYELCQIELRDLRSVVNAISPDVQYLRKQVIPGLLQQLAKNQYIQDNFGLFEFGKTSRKSESYVSTTEVPSYLPLPRYGVDELGLPIEDEHIAFGIISTDTQPAFFTLKAAVNEYLRSINIATVTYVHPDELTKKQAQSLAPWVKELFSLFKKGRVAVIIEQTNGIIGVIGEPSTVVAKNFGLKKQVALAEISVNAIAKVANLQPMYKEPSKYPVITEDYCFEWASATLYSEVQAIYDSFSAVAAKAEVSVSVMPVDIYSKLEKTKQITNRVVYSRQDKQITEQEVRALKEHLIAMMKKSGARLV